jgi:hypothetical protein
LIAADDTDGVHWRVGYNNFYVITRYNHSAMYAMAVYELAAAVKQRVLLNGAPAVAPAVAPSAPAPTSAPATAAPTAAAAPGVAAFQPALPP